MDTVSRVALVYVVLMLAIRMMGKRELSQLSPFELVTLLLIPELFQQALVRDDFSMVNALIAASTLFSLVFLTAALSHRFKAVQSVLVSEPAVLVHNGKFVEFNMNRERVTPEEILTEMHKSGLERLAQVKWAILEEDGRISLVPANPQDKQLKPREEVVIA
jgi:uncharacterized membrane protein YcaP (DUF421 family)